MIFYGIVCSSCQIFSDLGPSISHCSVREVQDPLFKIGPLFFFDIWIQMIVPSFPALFADSSRQSVCNVTPIFCSKLFNIFCQHFVFFFAPRPLNHGRIQNFLPSVQALNICTHIQVRCDFFPIFCSILLN